LFVAQFSLNHRQNLGAVAMAQLRDGAPSNGAALGGNEKAALMDAN